MGLRHPDHARAERSTAIDILKKLIGDKKQWRRMEARAAALPRDYRIVYSEIKSYLWKFSAGGGMDIIGILDDLLGLFETGAADGRGVLEVTGDDVAGFCDELLRNARTYTENWHHDLNRTVRKKLGGTP
jgi:DNA-binding ferritin-like protein (Dps family)